MNKIDTNVRELVSMIERGELRLPEMQRRYIWRASRVRDLLDSLYRGYPSGSILVWETDLEQPTRDVAVPQQRSPFSGFKLLLDGQQRLTSLSAVMRGEPVTVKGRSKPIEILFNLEHPERVTESTEVEGDEDTLLADRDEVDESLEAERDEEEISLQERMKRMTFVVTSRALEQNPQWISVSKVFCSNSDSELLKSAGVRSFDDPRYSRYSQRIQKLRDIGKYPYTMHVLPRELSYEEVADIFVRVNSLGVKLRGSDLAHAQITARWPHSLKLLEEFQKECEEHWMTLDLGLLVRAMVVFATEQSRFDRVASTQIQKLQQGWEKAMAGIRFAINFLRTNADIEDESLLSSPLFLITLAFFSQLRDEKLTEEESHQLLYWLYIANARGRYSRGSTESLLDADLNTLRRGGTPLDLIETVRQQFGRLNVEPTDFEGRGARSPLFSLVYLTLKAKGAKDWHTGLGLSLTHQGRYHYIECHHIFPKSLLKGRYEQQEIHEIANMAFVAGRTNRKIRNKEPVEYLSDIIAERGEQALTDQIVPLDQRLHKIENYREFLEVRRRELASAVNAFLEKVRTGTH